MYSAKTIAALTAADLLAAAKSERANAVYNAANGFEYAAQENLRIAEVYENAAAGK